MSAATIACPDCSQPVSKQAVACPSCGRPLRRKGNCLLQAILSLVVIAAGIWWMTTGMVEQAHQTMGQIQDQVAADSVAQYRIAAEQGDRMQMCVQAGLVVAALLQAQDRADYPGWKKRQKQDCRSVGVRF